MAYEQNMGPFKPVSFKGNARINGVPTFVDKLPLTLGGIAGENLKFGRLASIDPATNRREFILGAQKGVVKGIVMLDPSIARADPGMNDYYYAGRPATVITYGLIDILEYDITKKSPMEGSLVFARKDNGLLAFNDNDTGMTDYVKLNAYVYETLDPNGAKIFFGAAPLATATRETTTAAVVPVANPAAGQVTRGTGIALSSTTAGATILYTTDGTAPDLMSKVYNGPIVLSAAATIKAIAVKDGMDASTVLEAAYTIKP